MCLALAAAAKRFVGGWVSFEVQGESMGPTLRPGDWLLARKGQRLFPGDIVLAADPRDGRPVVKRVQWVRGGQVFLLGDNAVGSTDSRTFGPLPSAEIRARVLLRYGPLRRMGRIGHAETTATR